MSVFQPTFTSALSTSTLLQDSSGPNDNNSLETSWRDCQSNKNNWCSHHASEVRLQDSNSSSPRQFTSNSSQSITIHDWARKRSPTSSHTSCVKCHKNKSTVCHFHQAWTLYQWSCKREHDRSSTTTVCHRRFAPSEWERLLRSCRNKCDLNSGDE